MDLVDIIRHQIGTLPEGRHSIGLRSILRHVEAAYRHFSRGQTEPDESAFTDSIYRANQAFEGSIKEAFRVLAGKDPRKATPYQIEVYLEENKIFRNRVLAQFTNYRTEWRNPSTHDYNLDFDEDEAFLAIVSVSAFAKLLIDQIAERLSFVAVKQETKTFAAPPELNSTRTEKLLDRAIAILQEFARHYASNTAGVRLETEAQLIGAVSGFFSSLTPDTKIETDGAVGSKRTHRFDLALSEGDQRVIIEVKRSKSVHNVGDAIVQLAKLLEQAEVPDGILFLFSASTNNYSRRAVPVHGLGRARSVNILSPV